MRGSSCLEMTAGAPRRRLRFGDFFSRMWLENALRPRTLPVAVILKRFLAPECVFILGMARVSKADPPGWAGGALAVRLSVAARLAGGGGARRFGAGALTRAVDGSGGRLVLGGGDRLGCGGSLGAGVVRRDGRH